jgi:RNA polymerase sigma-70 factor (ECF subfamily)
MIDAGTVVLVRDRLVAFAERRVTDRADAEDLVQDVLLRVMAHPAPPRGEALEHWLFAATRNALTDHYRRRATRDRRVDRYAAEAALKASPEVRAADDEEELRHALAGCIAPLLRQLPPAYAEAVQAVDLAGERQVDLAARTTTPLPTVKSRVQRGRVMLREAFDACCAIVVDARGTPTDARPKTGAKCAAVGCSEGTTMKGER